MKLYLVKTYRNELIGICDNEKFIKQIKRKYFKEELERTKNSVKNDIEYASLKIKDEKLNEYSLKRFLYCFRLLIDAWNEVEIFEIELNTYQNINLCKGC